MYPQKDGGDFCQFNKRYIMYITFHISGKFVAI